MNQPSTDDDDDCLVFDSYEQWAFYWGRDFVCCEPDMVPDRFRKAEE